MKDGIRRVLTAGALMVVVGLSDGCTSKTNEPEFAPSQGVSTAAGPKDMKEWYEQNKGKAAAKKGAKTTSPASEAAPSK